MSAETVAASVSTGENADPSATTDKVRVVRVKRKREDDPADQLVIHLKRPDLREGEGNNVSEGIQLTRVEFDPENPTEFKVASNPPKRRHTAAARKLGSKQQVVHGVGTRQKDRARGSQAEARKAARHEKFRLTRNLETNASNDGQVSFVDLIKEASKSKVVKDDDPYSDITCNGLPLSKFKKMAINQDSGFTDRKKAKELEELYSRMRGDSPVKSKETGNDVYDYYVVASSSSSGASSGCLDDLFVPGAQFDVEEVYQSDDESESGASDSDDSNAENNYANDYPDEPSSDEGRDFGNPEFPDDDDPYNEYGEYDEGVGGYTGGMGNPKIYDGYSDDEDYY